MQSDTFVMAATDGDTASLRVYESGDTQQIADVNMTAIETLLLIKDLLPAVSCAIRKERKGVFTPWGYMP